MVAFDLVWFHFTMWRFVWWKYVVRILCEFPSLPRLCDSLLTIWVFVNFFILEIFFIQCNFFIESVYQLSIHIYFLNIHKYIQYFIFTYQMYPLSYLLNKRTILYVHIGCNYFEYIQFDALN